MTRSRRTSTRQKTQCICGEPSTMFQGRWLCSKHYRFGQMRASAKRAGKTVPSVETLNALVALGLDCQDCGIPMNWLARENQAAVASLQHYRDGTFGLVCKSCNTRHAYVPGDIFRTMPKGHQYCNECKVIKPIEAFYDRAQNVGPHKRSYCTPCLSARNLRWQNTNRERHLANKRAQAHRNRQRRKAKNNEQRANP